MFLKNPGFLMNRWQARREYDCSMRSGLIPSRALQERRIAHDRIGADVGEFHHQPNIKRNSHLKYWPALSVNVEFSNRE